MPHIAAGAPCCAESLAGLLGDLRAAPARPDHFLLVRDGAAQAAAAIHLEAEALPLSSPLRAAAHAEADRLHGIARQAEAEAGRARASRRPDRL